jgi:hypothetical protein
VCVGVQGQAIVACPSSSWTYFGWTPLDSSVQEQCSAGVRQIVNTMSSNPAFLTSSNGIDSSETISPLGHFPRSVVFVGLGSL